MEISFEPVPESATAADWAPVYLSAVPGTAQAGGEILTFDLPAPSEARQAGDPESRLPAIDRLEGFHPGGPSLYKRVLVPVCSGGRTAPTWLYTAEAGQCSWRLLPDGVWSR
ncbi:MAG: gamma-glutamylcyclotransferase [Deltaproteobacteria bacterium]|nr:gamma-glutamylcyclotransferase [Deltaproteobacteria bacterium]